jgi:hypothetical protein
MKDIENIISKETGIDISTNNPGVEMYSFRSLNELKAHAAIFTYGNETDLSCR